MTLRDEDGQEQTLRVTEEHPFYVDSQGWTAARKLGQGDILLAVEGTLAVVSNEREAHPQGVTVYNLEVEQAHTYFVLAEDANDAAAVWVHNATNYQRVQKLRSQGFEEHHIVSNKNPLTKDHELLALADFDLEARTNKMFLPKRAGMHPTRSIHSGKHFNSVSERLADSMDQIVMAGRAAGFGQQEYNAALRYLISGERSLLKAGSVALNKNKLPWAT